MYPWHGIRHTTKCLKDVLRYPCERPILTGIHTLPVFNKDIIHFFEECITEIPFRRVVGINDVPILDKGLSPEKYAEGMRKCPLLY